MRTRARRPGLDEWSDEEAPRPPVGPESRVPMWVVRVAGPALIVATVLVTYHAYAFADRLTARHVDMLAYSLPHYCYLGRTLAAAHP